MCFLSLAAVRAWVWQLCGRKCSTAHTQVLGALSLGGRRADGEMRHRDVLQLLVLASGAWWVWVWPCSPRVWTFFCRKMELSYLFVDETSDTWGQFFVFTTINFATVPHILLCVSPRYSLPLTS